MHVFTGELNGKDVERGNRRDGLILSRFQEWLKREENESDWSTSSNIRSKKLQNFTEMLRPHDTEEQEGGGGEAFWNRQQNLL